MELTPAEIVYLGAVALGTAVFHSVAAFSGGLLLAIFVAPVIGVKETVPVVSVALTISQLTRVFVFRHAVIWPVYRTIVAVSFPCLLLGILLYIKLPVNAVGLFLGAFLIGMVPLRRAMEGRRIAVGPNGLRLIAVPYGVLSGTAFGVGLMLGPFLLGAGVMGEALVATVAALGTTVNLTKTVVFGLSPLLTRELFIAGSLLGLVTIPGHYLGRWIVRRTPIRIHTGLIEAIILAGGCYFIWNASRSLGWI